MPDSATSVRRKPGPAARPFDEARALELLRAGWPAYKVRNEVRAGHLRKIVALARENGISLHKRRTDSELAKQEGGIRRLRYIGRSWAQIAAALGYGPEAASSIRQRYFRSLPKYQNVHAARLRWARRRLRELGSGGTWDDLESFARLASDPRRHWLLRKEEIEIARRCRILPERCMRVPAADLIRQSLDRLSERTSPPRAALAQ